MLNPNDLWLWTVAKGAGQTQAPTTEVRSSHVMVADTFTFDHSLTTSGLVPCVTPSWNAQPYVERIIGQRIEIGFSVPPPLGGTVDYTVSPGTTQSVSAGSFTATIQHNLNDSEAIILVLPSWNTQIWYGTKTANTIPISFTIPAPTGGGTLYWSRHAHSDDVADTDSVTEGRSTWTISHDKNRSFLPTFFLPNWPTIVRPVNRFDTNDYIVGFSVPAPSGAALDWRVKTVV